MCTHQNTIKTKYVNSKFSLFSNNYMRKYGKHCSKCCSDDLSNKLYVLDYQSEKPLYEYDYSQCVILCDECSTITANSIEPSTNWILVKIEELDTMNSRCQKHKDNGNICNERVKKEYHVFNPLCGYKVVGSSCIGLLNEEDIKQVRAIEKLYKLISKHLSAPWLNRNYTFNSAWLDYKDNQGLYNGPCSYFEISRQIIKLDARKKITKGMQTFFVKVFDDKGTFGIQLARNHYGLNFLEKRVVVNNLQAAKELACILLEMHIVGNDKLIYDAYQEVFNCINII
jgi:hypothetical protein